MWNERGMCANLQNITLQLLLKTAAVRYRLSRSMHWWTRFIALSITRAWQAIWRFLLQMFLAWECVSLPDVSETPCFTNSTVKRNQKPADRVNGLAKKYSHESRYFFKKSLRRKHGGQPNTDPCFYSVTSLPEPIINLLAPEFGI